MSDRSMFLYLLSNEILRKWNTRPLVSIFPPSWLDYLMANEDSQKASGLVTELALSDS